MAGAAQMSAYVSAGAAQMSADVSHTQPHMLLGTIQAITTAPESTLPHFSYPCCSHVLLLGEPALCAGGPGFAVFHSHNARAHVGHEPGANVWGQGGDN